MTKNFLSLLAVVMLLSGTIVYAQDASTEEASVPDSLMLRKKDVQQQQDYDGLTEAFPPRKKNKWQLGLQGGLSYTAGDIAGKPGWGAGITVGKPLNHAFAIRFQGLFASNKGQDWRRELINRKAGNNFKLTAADVELQGVLHLTNIGFHKDRSKVGLFVFGGVGAFMHKTEVDRFDANGNRYDFSSLNGGEDIPDKKDVLDALDALMDGEYETTRDHGTAVTLSDFRMLASLSIGAGISFNLGKKVDLNLEHRVSWHGSDRVDGIREDAPADWFHYSTVGIVFKLGKNREETLNWVNPMETLYEDVMELKSKMSLLDQLKDEDEDGVMDLFDEDNNTPPDVAVSTKGTALDSDADGVPDHLDQQPFSPPGASVNEEGVALDADGDGVPDIYDQEANTKEGALVDANGREIKDVGGREGFGALGDFDMIFFDFNSSRIKSQYYPHLYQIAAYMYRNNGKKLSVEGNTDNIGGEDYNSNLANKRAQNVVDYLVKNFKLPADRFEVVNRGEANPLVPNLPERISGNKMAHQLNRRVEFRIK